MSAFDPRVTPARADLAAAVLKGKVSAPRFAEGIAKECAAGAAPIRKNPDALAPLETELLFGERFTVYEEKAGWAWGQSGEDHYAGYIESQKLRAPGPAATHRVTALRTFVFPAASVKASPLDSLPMNAKLALAGTEGAFAKLSVGGFVAARHLGALAESADDFVSVAEMFMAAPYLWGGKTAAGLDCSGLMQTALERCGIKAPRDTDMQERDLGKPVPFGESFRGLRRGDLIFWQGHMGVMRDEATLLHANAFHMMVASEPLSEAVRRIGTPVRMVKRLA